MSSEITRRNFIKATGTAAGLAAAVGVNPRTYAQNDKIRLGIIGTGGQAQVHIKEGLRVNKDKIQIVATCDVWNYHLDMGIDVIKKHVGDFKVNTYSEYKEMLDKENLDAVLVATPLISHFDIVMDCLDAGLYVFCEKTLTMTIDQSRKIVEKCNEVGKWLQVGHQRRYNPYYNKAMWLTREVNLIGRVTHITGQWHRNDFWRRDVPPNYQMTENEKKHIPDLEKHVNWRLYNDMSAGLMTELGTHQLDVACWFLGSTPTRVSGMGGIEYWRDKRDAEDHVALIYEWDVKRGDAGFKSINRRSDFQSRVGTKTAYKVRMTYSSICTNAKSHYSELIQGEFGAFELIGEARCQAYIEPSYLKARAKAKERVDMAEAKAAGIKYVPTDADTEDSLQGGGELNQGVPLDIYTDENQSIEYDVWMANHNQWTAFAKDIRAGEKGMPQANQMAGLSSAICGHMGNEAIRSGKTVEILPDLMKFAFETPDPYAYYEVDGPKPGEGRPEEDPCPCAEDEAVEETGA
ncbi:Gfo/Idh/MocA family oxidoreductase [bacterium AH-315-P07]|nr:Gfo/Idh/MocA family oxidoreductase [bacterium AH-315-P07]